MKMYGNLNKIFEILVKLRFLDKYSFLIHNFYSFSATVPTVIVLSGVIGGLVFTVVAILVALLLKRSKNGSSHGGACSGGGKNGSDIVVISKDSMNKGSDGHSNNSSEMKVEVRTSSSLSNGK